MKQSSTYTNQNNQFSWLSMMRYYWLLTMVLMFASISTIVQAAPPTVAITNLVDNSTITGPLPVANVDATASDSDGTITQVDFYANGGLLGTDTTAPYSINVNDVVPGIYTVTAIATDNDNETTTSAAITVTVTDGASNTPPTVTLTNLADGSTIPGPLPVANVTADATDTDGTVSQVDFYANGNLLGTDNTAPYSVDVYDVLPGTYVVTAIATDNNNASTTSAAITVTVSGGEPATKQVYYIHTDHLNTPRLIEDQNQNTVWEWENQEAFGDHYANEDPNNTGNTFTYNHRFPGQYYDVETQTHYNYFRDYDPATGRYLQSDPIGLEGGINTYGYVNGSPLMYVDPEGLATWDVVDSFEASAVAGIGGKYATYTLKSGCSNGVRYTVTVQASGVSAGAGVKCKTCFTAPAKVPLSGQFDDRNGQKPNPQAFNGGFLAVGTDAHFMGFGWQWGDTLLGNASSIGSNSSMGFGTFGLEASGTIGTSTVTNIEKEPCSCEGGK